MMAGPEVRTLLRTSALAVLVSLGVAASGSAEETGSSKSRLAANIWTGLGVAEAQSTMLPGLKAGLSFGYKLLPQLSLVGLGEYHYWADDEWTFRTLFAGAGVRYQAVGWLELTLGAGYVRTWQERDEQRAINGAGLRMLAFVPLLAGFGPFAELEYSPHWGQPRAFQIAAATVGISYSF